MPAAASSGPTMIPDDSRPVGGATWSSTPASARAKRGEIGSGVDAVEYRELAERVVDGRRDVMVGPFGRRVRLTCAEVAGERAPRPLGETGPAAQRAGLAADRVELRHELPQGDRRGECAPQTVGSSPRATGRHLVVELVSPAEGASALLGERDEVAAPLDAVATRDPRQARGPIPLADWHRSAIGLLQRRGPQPSHDGSALEPRRCQLDEPAKHPRRRRIGDPVGRGTVPADPGLGERSGEQAAVRVARGVQQRHALGRATRDEVLHEEADRAPRLGLGVRGLDALPHGDRAVRVGLRRVGGPVALEPEPGRTQLVAQPAYRCVGRAVGHEPEMDEEVTPPADSHQQPLVGGTQRFG